MHTQDIQTQIIFSPKPHKISTQHQRRKHDKDWNRSNISDEYNYIAEWLAWHEIAGFDSFYIANNASSDDFIALLKPLEQTEHIKLIYQPTVKAGTQLKVLERIIQLATNEMDANEFPCHELLQNGREARCFKNTSK